MALEVSVGWKHILGSEPRSTTECPIARALREQHPMGYTWCVWLDRAAVWPGKVYNLPPKAVQFMANMLDKKIVFPFTFSIEEDE